MTATKRLGTAELLFTHAQQMGLQPSWLTPGGPFTVTTDKGEQYINRARSSLNSNASSSLAQDKYLSRLILDRHNLPNIPFSQPQTLKEAQAFLAEHSIIVVKPIKGSGAANIRIIDSSDQLDSIVLNNCIFEKYITGREMRYLVLDNKVIAAYESRYGTSVQQGRNLECISLPETIWDPLSVSMAVQIAGLLGLRFAAVDYLVSPTGQAYFLEINSSPDIQWFHCPSSGPIVDVAGQFLEATLREANHSAASARSDNVDSVILSTS